MARKESRSPLPKNTVLFRPGLVSEQNKKLKHNKSSIFCHCIAYAKQVRAKMHSGDLFHSPEEGTYHEGVSHAVESDHE